jgi:hypothetical protein
MMVQFFVSYRQLRLVEASKGVSKGLSFQDPQGVDGGQPVEDD